MKFKEMRFRVISNDIGQYRSEESRVQKSLCNGKITTIIHKASIWLKSFCNETSVYGTTFLV